MDKASTESANRNAPRTCEPDLTGRAQMTQNVIASWAGHLVFVIAGFILPRLIDQRIGQESLGVWDFGWSLVSYFGLVSGGLLSSVNRYVGRYRAAGDMGKVNTTVSTALMIHLCTGTIVLGLTLFSTVLLPTLFAERLGAFLRQAQWIVLLLGLSLVAQFVFAVFNGVITGCHRWSLHNGIGAGVHVLTTSAMIVSLLAGGGLRAMAVAVLAGEVISGLLRLLAAHRVCPGLRTSFHSISLRFAWELIRFGGKSFLAMISVIVLYQTTSLLIVYFLGPASLALYSRPMSLVRHARAILDKFALVLSPTASALQSNSDQKALQELLVSGTRYGLYIALPMVLILTLLGGPLLRLWMGERYEQGTVLAIMAVGHLALFSQRATYHILVGMNRHGLPGAARLAAALCSISFVAAALGPLGWGLVGAALAVVVPLTIVNTLVIPVYACFVLETSYPRYLIRTGLGPLTAALPFATCLLLAKYSWPDDPVLILAGGLSLGGLVLGTIYWRYVVPGRTRSYIMRLAGQALGRRPLLPGT